MTTYVGQPVARKEDARLISGQGTYVANYQAPGLLHLVVVRSPFAHARIRSIDTAAATAAPGVVAVLTGADLDGAYSGLPCFWPVSDDIKMPPHLPLATDKARHVGDGVAIVVAESAAAAKDAAELVEVDYEPLPAVTDVVEAHSDTAPLVPTSRGTSATRGRSSPGEPDRVFAGRRSSSRRRTASSA
ncbi:MAG: hypothetical protein R3C15_13830 [Thermoleophilia bacterium]